jgi:hypothetical protein
MIGQASKEKARGRSFGINIAAIFWYNKNMHLEFIHTSLYRST